MLAFTEYLLEIFHDSLQGSTPEETERHRKTYYDDTHEDGTFHQFDGRYVLDRDRTDLHDSYKKGEQIKLTSVQQLTDKKGVMRYHGITEHGKAIPMSHFKKPRVGRVGKNQQSLEAQQIDYLQNAIKEKIKANKGKPIKIKTPNGETHEVAGIKQVTGGWPKADAYLHDKDGKPVHWMSLKGDKFQQWGGYKDVDEHPIMKSAIEQFVKLKNKIAPEGKYLPPKSAYHIPLDKNNPEHKQFLYKSMYGREHGGEYGPHNVHAIYSGNTIGLKEHKEPGVFELDPTALYVNRNNEHSDTSDAKILVTNRAGMNQRGTGGRIMISHIGNVSNSKDISGGSPAPAVTTEKKKVIKPAVAVSKPKPTINRGEFGVNRGDGPRTLNSDADHGGRSFYTPQEKSLMKGL